MDVTACHPCNGFANIIPPICSIDSTLPPPFRRPSLHDNDARRAADVRLIPAVVVWRRFLGNVFLWVFLVPRGTRPPQEDLYLGGLVFQ